MCHCASLFRSLKMDTLLPFENRSSFQIPTFSYLKFRLQWVLLSRSNLVSLIAAVPQEETSVVSRIEPSKNCCVIIVVVVVVIEHFRFVAQLRRRRHESVVRT